MDIPSSEKERMLLAREELSLVTNGLNDFYSKFESCMKKLHGSDIMQSFYRSGPLGKEKEEEINRLFERLKKYIDNLENGSNSLKTNTNRFINERLMAIKEMEESK